MDSHRLTKPHTHYKSWRAGRHHGAAFTHGYRYRRQLLKKAKRTGNSGISYSNNDPKSQLQVSQRMKAMRGSLQSSLSQRFCTRRPPRRARSGSMRGLTRRGRHPDWVWCWSLDGRPTSAVRRRRRYVFLSRRAMFAKEVSRTAGGGAFQRRAKARQRLGCMAKASRRR